MTIVSPSKAAVGRRVRVFGFDVFSDDLALIPIEGPCATVSTISPNSYGLASRDRAFHEALTAADCLVLDGVYFGLASILLKGQVIRANQGPEVFRHFMRRLDAAKGRAFFLGASEDTLRKIVERGAVDYPGVRIGTHSPPYKPVFSEADNREMLARVNAFAPDVLFIGMTAPKQEKWAHEHRDRIRAGLAVSIGGVFDWYAGNEREVAPIWWKLKLGWLIRTIQRPAILKRYPSIFVFFWHLLLAVLRIKRFPG